MAKAKGIVITQADIARFKAKEAAKTPAQRVASSKNDAIVNTAANRMKPKRKA